VGASAAVRKKNALGQNVIIQSIGASSGVIVAGAVFTIPGLYILQAKYPEIEVDFWQIFFSSLLGGFLGILFLIPFRKYFVKDMHGKLPFPEATATTEILMTGEKGGSQAKLLIVSGIIGGLFDFCFSAFRCNVRLGLPRPHGGARRDAPGRVDVSIQEPVHMRTRCSQRYTRGRKYAASRRNYFRCLCVPGVT
jgi:hypothetical protein